MRKGKAVVQKTHRSQDARSTGDGQWVLMAAKQTGRAPRQANGKGVLDVSKLSTEECDALMAKLRARREEAEEDSDSEAACDGVR